MISTFLRKVSCWNLLHAVLCQHFLSGFRNRPASPLGKKDFGQNYFNRCPVINAVNRFVHEKSDRTHKRAHLHKIINCDK